MEPNADFLHSVVMLLCYSNLFLSSIFLFTSKIHLLTTVIVVSNQQLEVERKRVIKYITTFISSGTRSTAVKVLLVTSDIFLFSTCGDKLPTYLFVSNVNKQQVRARACVYLQVYIMVKWQIYLSMKMFGRFPLQRSLFMPLAFCLICTSLHTSLVCRLFILNF